MSKHTNCPLTTHSFAWQRVGLLLSLSLMAAPLAPAIAPSLASAEELSGVETEITSNASEETPSVENADESEHAPEAVSSTQEDTSVEADTASVTSSDQVATPALVEDAQDDSVDDEVKTSELSDESAEPSPLNDEATTLSEEQEESPGAADSQADQKMPEVTVLYEANDGTDTVKTATIKDGSVVLPSAESLSLKSPAGKVFGGWYMPTKTTVDFYKAGDSLALTQEQLDTLAKDNTPLRLYALWLDPDQLEDETLGVSKTPVFFTSAPEDGGTLSDKVVYVPDSEETVMDSVVADPASGYVFNGWYKDGEKISDDAVLDPVSVEGVISKDDVTAHPAVICASFVPESEAEPQDQAPDLSNWRDPDGIARNEGTEDESVGDGMGPTPDDPYDDRNTTRDAELDPSMNDPELIDQAAQSLSDPSFVENATNISDSPDNAQANGPTVPVDPSGDDGTQGDNTDPSSTSTNSGTTSATTSSTTKTSTTPYSSYSHYTPSTYKGTTTGTSSAYTTSSYKPSTTTTSSYPYSSVRSTQLAQTSDNAMVALIVCMVGFVAAVAGIAFMTLRHRVHK